MLLSYFNVSIDFCSFLPQMNLNTAIDIKSRLFKTLKDDETFNRCPIL